MSSVATNPPLWDSVVTNQPPILLINVLQDVYNRGRSHLFRHHRNKENNVDKYVILIPSNLGTRA